MPRETVAVLVSRYRDRNDVPPLCLSRNRRGVVREESRNRKRFGSVSISRIRENPRERTGFRGWVHERQRLEEGNRGGSKGGGSKEGRARYTGKQRGW